MAVPHNAHLEPIPIPIKTHSVTDTIILPPVLQKKSKNCIKYFKRPHVTH
ncbi:hypothetical protein DOY81_005677 [Sarcophaga bullata]|nr:hypothetical protein DOY81_005677 [Sarcophaga bullata]